jgi:hypothetical protein
MKHFFRKLFQFERPSHYLRVFLTSLALCLCAACAARAEDEPIAYIGHGAFFDKAGNEILLTPEFVEKAQSWYREKLFAGLKIDKQREFAQLERKFNDGLKAEGQSRLLIQHRMLDWLIANAGNVQNKGRIEGKLRALEYAMNWKLPASAEDRGKKVREEFKIDPALEERLKLPVFNPERFKPLSFTINKGQAYIDECANAGVPIPPSIGVLDPNGVTGWKSQGFIDPTLQFIVQSPAQVRTYKSTSPPGMCIALPRYTDASLATVALDGVICLGQTGKVCFWDNQKPTSAAPGAPVKGFPFPAGTVIPIGVPNLAINPAGLYQAGGAEIENGTGGVCTDCHAGQNPYIVHPNADLGGGKLFGDLAGPPENLPMMPPQPNAPTPSLYDPIVGVTWYDNKFPHPRSTTPVVCRGCHSATGGAGAFPHLSQSTQSYCGTILAKAITNTMPPGNPGSKASDPQVIAFKNWCGVPANSDTSDRGDPHLTTANGVNYDFQSAGEFTALRNEDTQFELQTRQTPVSTTFTPGANAYTGLASCVSLNTAVALRLGKNRLTYQGLTKGGGAERLELRLDGKLVTLSRRGLRLAGDNIVSQADGSGGIEVTAADGTRVIITPNFWESQGYWYLNIEVLNTPAKFGTMGHIPTGDWLPLAPDGGSFGPAPASLSDRYFLLNSKFADSWRVTGSTSLFDYAPGTSTADFTDTKWPPESQTGACKAPNATKPPPEPMKEEQARKLCGRVEDKAAFENCVLDLTATGDVGMLKAYLRTLKLRDQAANGPPR